MEHVLTSAIVSFAALFPIVDPIGNVPAFLVLTGGCTSAESRSQAWKAALAAAVMLVVFLVSGHAVLQLFDVSLAAVEFVGGLIIGYTGWQMAVGDPDEPEPSDAGREVWFHPIAFPLLAGPGALAAVLGLSNRNDSLLDFPGFLIGIVGVCAVGAAAIVAARPIARRLGTSGVEVLRRIMGLVVLAIAAEMVFHGIEDHFGLVAVD
jgi:multiple antibiotic resistance protein